MSLADMRAYLEYVADRRLAQLGLDPIYGSANPFAFMELQDVQELSNFFERRVSAYQVGVSGTVALRRRLLSRAPVAPPAHRRRSGGRARCSSTDGGCRWARLAFAAPRP